MQQASNQEPEYIEECKIIIKGFKSIGLEYSKRFINGKEFGHMNDFQSYERLDIQSVVKFLKSKPELKRENITFVQGCKTLKTFRYIRSCFQAAKTVY